MSLQYKCSVVSAQVAVIQAQVAAKQKDCENDLAKAEPSLAAATAALNTLNKVCPNLDKQDNAPLKIELCEDFVMFMIFF